MLQKGSTYPLLRLAFLAFAHVGPVPPPTGLPSTSAGRQGPRALPTARVGAPGRRPDLARRGRCDSAVTGEDEYLIYVKVRGAAAVASAACREMRPRGAERAVGPPNGRCAAPRSRPPAGMVGVRLGGAAGRPCRSPGRCVNRGGLPYWSRCPRRGFVPQAPKPLEIGLWSTGGLPCLNPTDQPSRRPGGLLILWLDEPSRPSPTSDQASGLSMDQR